MDAVRAASLEERWLAQELDLRNEAHSGIDLPPAVIVEELLFQPVHGLIDQSLHSRLGVETTNGDGFGIGWYADGDPVPARYRRAGPIWIHP